MKYKILLKIPNSSYYKYYQVSESEGDWSSTDKVEAVVKINELLENYGKDEINVVFDLEVTNTIDIPEIPAP